MATSLLYVTVFAELSNFNRDRDGTKPKIFTLSLQKKKLPPPDVAHRLVLAPFHLLRRALVLSLIHWGKVSNQNQ